MDIDTQIENYRNIANNYQLTFFAMVNEAEIRLYRTYTTDELKKLWVYWLSNEFDTIDDQLDGIIDYTINEL